MRATRERVPLSLVALDLDQLKELNDGHGHGAGDEALRSLASLLGGCMRRSDFLCRMGGDEFVLVLPGARLADAVRQCERWRVAFDRTPVILEDGGTVHVTFSAGVAEHLPHETAISLLQRADAALYEAKRTGRNRVLAAPRPEAERR
jgi:diguanylate cyclase